MTRETTIIVLGMLIAVSPFVGLPLSLLSWILPVLAAVIIIIANQIRLKRKARRLAREKSTQGE